jgi:hypothetical protein
VPNTSTILPPTPTAENLRPLRKLLAEQLGCRPSPATLWRWTTKGIRVGPSRVKLEAVRVGRQLYASPEAVARFIEAQNRERIPAKGTSEADIDERLRAAGLL